MKGRVYMLTLEGLKNFGANTDEGLGRCMGNEALYIRLIGMLAGEANFDKLKEAVDAGDLKAAFEAAHALKGVLGNLSLTPIYEPANELTELLRAEKEADYSAYVSEILEKRDELFALMK